MKAVYLFVVSLALVSLGMSADLPRASPETQGIAAEDIRKFVLAADKQLDSLHSLMIVRHGNVVAEGWWAPYNAESPHMLYSLSKSFTSTAVGLAAEEGKLSVDDPVLKFFPEDAPAEPSENLKAMRVRDLLSMSTGHATEPPRKPAAVWTKDFLAHPVQFKPGTKFLYNTSATYVQSALVQKVSGKTVLEYLGPKLFEPLGIKNPTWEKSPQGISTGGYGLSVRTEDIAKFGQLYLQKGQWNGKQLVPEKWIEMATSKQVENGSNPNSDWNQGYGFQFWRCRHGAYRGDGAFGQYCIVMPDQDAVIAMTSGLKDMQAVLNLVWELQAAMKPTSLPENNAARAQLAQSLKGLSLRPQSGEGKPNAEVVGKTFTFPANDRKFEAVTLVAAEGEKPATIVARIDGAERRLECPTGAWHKGRLAWGQLAEQPAASSGAWTAADTFTARVCFYETPYVNTLTLKFNGNDVQCVSEMNVNFGPTKLFDLKGTAK